MKRKKFSWVTFSCSQVSSLDNNDWLYLLPSVEFKHKYWYLWQFMFSWFNKGFIIDICRKDWNKYNNN